MSLQGEDAMNRPVNCALVPLNSARPGSARPSSLRPSRGFTLIEVLMATALTALLMVGVVEMFAAVGDAVNNSRSILELSGRLRTTQARLQMDLDGITVTMLPPRRPEGDEGYAEFREGPIGPVISRLVFAFGSNPVDPAGPPISDLTVNDIDDILMFTTRSKGRPFLGRVGGVSRQTDIAEDAWIVRGTTLYRRVLLVAPRFQPASSVQPDGFYRNNDLSVHFDGTMVANTLADLTRRECRFAHYLAVDTALTPPTENIVRGDPHVSLEWATLGLPTLRECSAGNWPAGAPLPGITLASNGNTIDYWEHPLPYVEIDQSTGTLRSYLGPRIAEDVILTNVIGFDMQVWDPGAPVISDGNLALGPADEGYSDAVAAGGWNIVSYGAYVDLGYDDVVFDPTVVTRKQFHHIGDPRSGNLERIYDTWSTHYEHDGVDQYWDDGGNPQGIGEVDLATDGFDNDGFNGVDDAGERETSAPYPVPLRGIRVKIRAYEPDSLQIREVTVVADFLPK
ncbi:MAG: prepilin-type N-terminal cleavage/methylation domain-containing protein [Thermoguttaceae bacterium]